jgi:hypothetical protein
MGDKQGLWEFGGRMYTTDGENIYLDEVDRIIADAVPPQSEPAPIEDTKALERRAEEAAAPPAEPVDMRPRPGRTEAISEVVKKYVDQYKEGQK